MSDTSPTPGRDPRLEIPEVLREPPLGSPTLKRRAPLGTSDSMWGMAKAWGVALDFIFTIVAGGLLGYGFDRWKGTAPTGIMCGIGLGFVVAFIRIVRATLRQEREDARRRAEQRRQPPV